MTNDIYSLKSRALILSEKKNVDSISPSEVGMLHYDVLEYMSIFERGVKSLGIKRVYTSISGMEADGSPKSTDGADIKFGQLVIIYDKDNTSVAGTGNIYAFQNPGWLIVGNISNVSEIYNSIREVKSLISDYNVSKLNGGASYDNLSAAISLVPDGLRCVGMKVTFIYDELYKETSGSCTHNLRNVTFIFDGDKTADWLSADRWMCMAPVFMKESRYKCLENKSDNIIYYIEEDEE